MAISPQQLTIYLYSAHHAVIFAIAQLSCLSKSQHPTSETSLSTDLLWLSTTAPLKRNLKTFIFQRSY